MNVTKLMRSDYFDATGHYGSDNEVWNYYFNFESTIVENKEKKCSAAKLKCVDIIFHSLLDTLEVCNLTKQELRTDVEKFVNSMLNNG